MSASSDYLRVLTDITRDQGATRAATQRANSQIYGNAVAKLGDFASDAVRQYGIDKKARKQEQEDAAITKLFTDTNQEWQAQQQSAQMDALTGAPAMNSDGTPTVGPQQPPKPTRSSPFPTPSELMSVARPERAIPIINGLATLYQAPVNDPEKNLTRRQKIAEMLNAFPEPDRSEAYPMIKQFSEQTGLARPGELSETFNPQEWRAISGTLAKPEKAPGTREVRTVDEQGREVIKIVPDVAGGTYPVAAPTTKGPTSLEGLKIDAANKNSPTQAQSADILTNLPADTSGHFQSEDFLLNGKQVKGSFDPSSGKYFYLGQDVSDQARRIPPVGVTISPTFQAEQGNARVVAEGIKNGTVSPEILLSSRSTAQGIALQAELQKLGVDANKMTREWTATKRAITSLNGAQQIRLAEVINKASESLDKVEELNKAWTDVGARSGIKILNRASLRAAQNGAYGPEAASVAQRLDAQIADVTSELAQGIMGGNSPTDHAFELAKKNLSADWTQAVLNDAIKQARYNLNLAQNARNDILEKMGVQSTQVPVPPPVNAIPPAAPKVNPFR